MVFCYFSGCKDRAFIRNRKKFGKKIGLSHFISDFCRRKMNMLMRKRVFLLLSFCFFVAFATMGQPHSKHRLYSVAFYNLENLFDTIHDEGKNDYDFLPDGSYKWNTKKYKAKLQNLAQVLSSLSRERVPQGPAFIGVAEVENDRVLDDLTKQPSIANYKYIHVEGPDKRGIDCALLYDPAQFEVKASRLVFSEPFQGDTLHPTRGFLIVDGQIADERICVIVNHWPSRGAESPVRIHAARQVKALADSLRRKDHRLKLVIMGDMNDDPMDESMCTLGARKWKKDVGKDEFYNPWWEVLEDEEEGTLLYRGKWNLFDQIVLSKPLLKKRRGLRYAGHEIFSRDYLFQKSGKFEGYPLRTHGGRTWLNGYSDHLPTIIYLKK